MKLARSTPGTPGAFLGGALLQASLAATRQLRAPLGGEIRHARGDFEEHAEEEVRRMLIESCDRHEPAEVGEVMESNALF